MQINSLNSYDSQVGLDKRYVTEDTRILFCTTGVLLEKLISKKSLDGFTHIILDEVHERDKDMDFLFIIIRMLMCQNESKVKVVLMSATINAQKVSQFKFSILSHSIFIFIFV